MNLQTGTRLPMAPEHAGRRVLPGDQPELCFRTTSGNRWNRSMFADRRGDSRRSRTRSQRSSAWRTACCARRLARCSRPSSCLRSLPGPPPACGCVAVTRPAVDQSLRLTACISVFDPDGWADALVAPSPDIDTPCRVTQVREAPPVSAAVELLTHLVSPSSAGIDADPGYQACLVRL